MVVFFQISFPHRNAQIELIHMRGRALRRSIRGIICSAHLFDTNIAATRHQVDCNRTAESRVTGTRLKTAQLHKIHT